MSMNMKSRVSIRSGRPVLGWALSGAAAWLACAAFAPGLSTTLAQPAPKPKPAGQTKGTQKAASPAATPEVVQPEETNKELPKDFVPPGPTHPHFLIKETWDFNPFKDKRDQSIQSQKFRSMLSLGSFAAGEDNRKADIRIVQDNIRWRLSQFTLEENRETIQELRLKILTDLRINGRKGDANREVRQEIIDTILREVPELMKYHFIARLNGAILLSELNEFESDGNAQTPAVPLTAAHELLIKILGDASQLEAVRLYGIIGLGRILTGVPELKLATRYKIVDALVAQVDPSQKQAPWYQFRLMDAIGACGTLENQNRELVVPQALGRVLADATRPRHVRVEAAYSLARLPLNEKIDLKQVANEVAWLAHEGGEEYFKVLPVSTEARVTMLKLYVVFKPIEESEKNRGLLVQAEKKAQLKKYKPDLDDVYKKVLPVVRATAIQKNPKEAAKALEGLATFLKANPRQDKSFVEGMPELRKKSPQAHAGK
jgi:hypothetical protein